MVVHENNFLDNGWEQFNIVKVGLPKEIGTLENSKQIDCPSRLK